MPITNALIGRWSQISAVHVWIYPQCNVLPVTSSVNCHVSCYNKVWALLKITTVFKHLFGLDKYLGLHYICHWIPVQHHHCQLKINDDGKQVPRYVHVTGRWRSCLTGLAISMGLAVKAWVGHTLHLWLPYQFHCTVLLWKQGHNNVPGTGQVNWNHILLLLLLPILCRAASSAALSHTGGFRVGGGVHDSYTFQCGLVGSFTSPGIDTR